MIKQKLKRGESKKVIRQQLEGSVETDVIDSIIDRAEEEQYKFWFKNEKGVIKIIPIDFKRFLQDNGFYKYCPEVERNQNLNRFYPRLYNNLNSQFSRLKSEASDAGFPFLASLPLDVSAGKRESSNFYSEWGKTF